MSATALLLTLLAALVAVELGLRVATMVQRKKAAPATAGRSFADGYPTLLCVGDSNTYGLNLPRGESYPCHLQALVGDRARVVNRGWPGASSSLMAAYLPGWLAADRPAIVYVMAGINNRHNPLGGTYDAIVARGLYRPGPVERARRLLHRGLWHLHLYRLLFWTFGAREGGWSEAVEAPADIYRHFREQPFDSYEGAQRHSMRREVPDPWPALEGGGLEPAAAAAAIRAYFEAIGPGAEVTEYDINLVRHARQRLDPAGHASVLDAARAALSPDGYRLLTEAADRVSRDFGLVEHMLWFDLAQMHDACRAAGAQLVLLTYPSQVFGALIDEFSRRHGVPWIDSNAAFGPLGIRRRDKTDNGLRLNSTGNLRLARHVLAESLRRGFVALSGAEATASGPARSRDRAR
ncbi:MAG: hypothetical protein CVU56_13615 [Deltaproteobacteria bacterium HGW-Deltaproteobacteria-14]|jgi:hypothetical protein|nr:MAG: hypothetical protein CVU56_13615 [Deltaproteobacteria bacterium HGW-Deltaproteobacteria-14]